jgi:hypothetical protein
MRKEMKLNEAALTKGALPRTRAALLKRIKEIKQAQATAKTRSKPGGPRS